MVIESSVIPLQIDFFIDYIPWMGIGLMSCGFFLLVSGQLLSILEDEIAVAHIGFVIAITGLSIIFINTYIDYRLLVVISLLVLSKWLEGITALRFYQKLAYMFKSGDSPSQSSLTLKIVASIITFFLFIIGVWICLFILITGSFYYTVTYEIALVWTLMTVFISLLGMGIKVWSVRGDLPAVSLAGFLLVISGAGIVNFDSLFTELIAFILGTIAYTGGYWFAAILWLKPNKRTEETNSKKISQGLFRTLLQLREWWNDETTPVSQDNLALLVYFSVLFLLAPVTTYVFSPDPEPRITAMRMYGGYIALISVTYALILIDPKITIFDRILGPLMYICLGVIYGVGVVVITHPHINVDLSKDSGYEALALPMIIIMMLLLFSLIADKERE